jgi:hypothetical protein
MVARRRGAAPDAARGKETAMKIRNLVPGITRFVVLGAMAASLFFGSVAGGSRHEAAAANSDCAYMLTKATSFKVAGDARHAAGDYAGAAKSYETAVAYYTLYNSMCF